MPVMTAVGVILPLVAAAFLVRVLAVTLLRQRHPAAASFVDRNWAWLPIVAFVLLVSWWSWPMGLLAAAVATVVVARPGLFGLPTN